MEEASRKSNIATTTDTFNTKRGNAIGDQDIKYIHPT